MTYAAGNKILASDLNSFISTFNGLWSTGSGSYGYGQPALSGISGGQLIRASNWSPLVDNLRKVLLHQGTAFTPMTTPAAGTQATSLTSLIPNYTAAEGTGSRFNSASVGDTTTYRVTATSTTSFNQDQTIVITASFGSHDNARYFFNAGGQFDLSFSHPTAPLAALAAGLGNIRFGAGTQTIGGTNFTGITKLGGTNNADSAVLTTNNFYNIPASDKIIAYQSISTNNLPTMEIYANYNQAGTITFTIKSYPWTGTQPASPPNIAAGSTVTVAARQPPTTYFTNSWGPITFTTSVTQTGAVRTQQWYLYATSSIVQVPAGVTSARVILIGGGGGGETATGLTIKGGGAGGAGQIVDKTIATQAGGYITCIIGAGGAGTWSSSGGDPTAGNGEITAIVHIDTTQANGGNRGGQNGNVLGQGGNSGSGYGGGQAYIYGRQVYAGGGGGGNNYYGFNAAQSGTAFQGEGGIGGVGVTLGPINGNYYSVGGGGQGGMNKKITNWTLTDETGYKYGGGLGGVSVGVGGDGVAGTGGGGGGGAQNTSFDNVLGGNGGSGFVAIYM